MSSSSVSATVVFALFAFLFIGVMLAGAFVIDRRRVKDVQDSIPERIDAARDARERVEQARGPAHIEVHLAPDPNRRHGASDAG
ncbi:hypothetical protein GCM10028801_27500 [Nocardioides maradonensis]